MSHKLRSKADNKSELDSLVLNVKNRLNAEVSDSCSIRLEKHIECDFSDVIFISVICGSDESKYIIKKIRESEFNTLGERASEREYNTLVRLYGLFEGKADIGVPEPMFYIEEHDALVMKAYDVELMQVEMKYLQHFSSSSKFNTLQKHFNMCGSWLQTVHQASDKIYSDVSSLDDMHKQIKLRLNMLDGVTHKLIPDSLCSDILNQLESLISVLSNKKIYLSEQHSDFGVWNTLSSEENIIIIDFTGCEPAPNGVDFVSTLVYLDSLKSNPFNNKRRVNAIINDFVNGYGSTIEIDKDIWNLIELIYRIRELLGAVFLPGNWRFPFLANRVIRYQLQWLLNVNNRVYLRSRSIE